MKDVKNGGRDERACPKGNREVDSTGDAVVSKTASSIGAGESTSKTGVVIVTKKEKIFPMSFFLSPEAQVRDPLDWKRCQITEGLRVLPRRSVGRYSW